MGDSESRKSEFCKTLMPKISGQGPTLQGMKEAFYYSAPSNRSADINCRIYHAWTTIPWAFVCTLSRVLKGLTVNTTLAASLGLVGPICVFYRLNMTISWLQGQSGVLNADVEKDVCWVNDTTWFDAGALDDSEYGHRHHTEPPASVVDVNTWKTRYNRAILLSDLQIRPGKVIHFGSLFGPERVEVRSEGHQMLERYITDSFDIWGQDILATTYTAEDHIQTWIKFVNKTLSGSLGLHQQTSDGGFIKDASQNIELVTAWVREIIQMVKQT